MSPTVNASGEDAPGGVGEGCGGAAAAGGAGDAFGGCGEGGGACGWGAGCARTDTPMGWMASASKQISRDLTRTRQRPHAVSMGSAGGTAPHSRRKLEIDHDFPLIQMSGDIVIESEAHQHHQQGNPHLLTEALGTLRQRAPFDGFHQLINHLPTVQ